VTEHIAVAINRPTPAPAPETMARRADDPPFNGDPAPDIPEAAAESSKPGEKKAKEKKAKAEGAKPHAPMADSVLDHIERSQKDFKILGYDHERYYFFQNERKQIMVLTKGDFTDSGLIELSRVNWWERNFPGSGNTTIDKKAAVNWIVVCAARKGVYDMRRVRGRGGYLDAGRFAFHHGGYLSVDGEIVDMTQVENSRYVYELATTLPPPAEDALTSEEGERLLDVAKSFRWTKGGSGALLAGWVALAPLCGALKWRPHIWITGGAGSGKSTIVNEYVNPLCAGVNIFAQGSSSEAGIRQTLGTDALPVIYDEAEQNDLRDQSRVQAILALARQASTESQAKTLKGSAGGEAQAFHIRSMFCMSSVQVGLKQQADVERIAILNVKSKRDDSNSVAKWEELQASLLAIQLDTTLPQRLLRRSMNQFHTTLKAITVFCKVAAEHFGSVRDGDQYGTLLAGAWSLISTEVPTPEQATQMLNDYDWTEHMEASDADESERAKSAWLESHVRMSGGLEVTVYEMIKAACGKARPGEPLALDGAASAAQMLQRYGMRITNGDEFILLSNTSQELKGLIPDIADLRGLLLRLPGASRYDNAPIRFNGAASKCIAIPLKPILQVDEDE
jgi:putative DNA primase/helicase